MMLARCCVVVGKCILVAGFCWLIYLAAVAADKYSMEEHKANEAQRREQLRIAESVGAEFENGCPGRSLTITGKDGQQIRVYVYGHKGAGLRVEKR